MSGPASQTTSNGGSVTTAQSPFDVLAQELFHQNVPMGVDVTPEGIGHDLVDAPRPASLDQSFELREETGGHFCMECGSLGGHDAVPLWTV